MARCIVGRWCGLLLLVLACACAGAGSGAVHGDLVAAEDADGGTSPRDAGIDGAPETLDTGPSVGEERAAVLAVPESERWTLPALHGEVHVLRTEANVPHIYATDRHDLYLVQGFVVARDRYLQFEMGRRLGQGRLSELLGDTLLAIDMRSRGVGWPVVAERILAHLAPSQGEVLDAFAAGVNAYRDAVAAGKLPPPGEFEIVGSLLGVEPASLMTTVGREDVAAYAAVIVSEMGWETTDVARSDIEARFAQLFGGPAATGDDALRRAAIIEDLWSHVEPVHAVASAHGWGLEEGEQTAPLPEAPASSAAPARRRAAPARVETAALTRLAARCLDLEQALGRGPHGQAGSNVWAVSLGDVPGGGGLLANDGHLSLSVPALFYQVGMNTQLFGEDGVHLTGLLFPGFPYLAVGTNGHVAWGQTYPRADVSDWYAEEIQLSDDGLPAASRFRGEWRPLVRTDESYTIADVALLGSVGRTEVWPRWTTFDGRWLTSIEGRAVAADELDDLAPGEVAVTMLGDLVVPGDQDDDGTITAISFDYTGFDVGPLMRATDGFQSSRNVREFREHTRGLVAYAQNIGAADGEGGIFYTSYTALPCRRGLTREADGGWAEGADPRLLLDGTRFGGFRIPLDAEGRVDEAASASDPSACVVPFAETPQVVDPARGFVLNANNDPGGITFDDSLTNDPWYIGGPWDTGHRAQVIHDGLSAAVAAGDADVAAMAALQASVRSIAAEHLVPFVAAAVARARAFAAAPPADGEPARLSALYAGDATALDEAATRLESWVTDGAIAASGVATFYDDPSEQDRTDAVATMIFHAWFRHFVAGLFDDEDVDFVFQRRKDDLLIALVTRLVDGRGPDNPLHLASWDPETGDSILFDVVGTPERETGDEIALRALVDALAALREPSGLPGWGGFGTEDMDEWLWGLRHFVQFDSLLADFVGDNPAIALLAKPFRISPERLPLATDMGPDDPRRGLPWFPRPGGWFTVDAADPRFEHGDWTYTHGPVMRMVIALDHGRVSGQNVLPGGQSALADSPHFDDQAARWLGNDAYPFRYHPMDVVAGATSRERYGP